MTLGPSNLPIDDATSPTHKIRGEKLAVEGGLDVLGTVILVGEHTRIYDTPFTIVVTSTPDDLTANLPAESSHALIYFEGETSTDMCRYLHAATPTASEGKRLKDHEEIVSLSPGDFQFVLDENAGGNGVLVVEPYHYE